MLKLISSQGNYQP